MLRGWLHVNERLQHAADCGKYAAEGENEICRGRGNRDMTQKGKSRYDEERTKRKKELLNEC